MKNLKHLNKYFVKYKWHLILGVIFVGLSNVFRVKVPQEIRKALDYILTNSQSLKSEISVNSGDLNQDLFEFCLSILGYAFLMGVFMYFMRQTIIVMSRLIEYDLRKDIFAKYESLDFAFFKRNKTGDLMARVSEDVGKVRMYLGPAILYAINLLFLFTTVIYSMLQVNTTLTIYTLAPLPLLSISIYFVSSIINRKSEAIQKQLSVLNSVAQEVYSGIRVVKSYVKESQFGEYFLKESEGFKDKSMELAYTNALFYPLMILLVSMSTLITLVVGGIQVSKGLATPGNIAEFVIYVNMLTWPVTSIGWVASIIQQAEASQKRINEMLFSESSIVNNPTKTTQDIEGKISFKNVHFTYPESGIEAIKNVNFELAAGEKIAIIGKTASGKSTIADLLLRMYDTNHGSIQIDGKSIKEWDLTELRHNIGYVPQDVFLFSDSIQNNIAFGNRVAPIERVKEYADHAAIGDEIEALAVQYDTLVGERGVTLSGGQKQRISIARAFIKDPKIIILDDCLSAVDTVTEQRIFEYLRTALEGKTSILITHRISNLLDFDKIMVLDEGEILEFGSPADLLQKKGYYYSLLEQQNLDEF